MKEAKHNMTHDDLMIAAHLIDEILREVDTWELPKGWEKRAQAFLSAVHKTPIRFLTHEDRKDMKPPFPPEEGYV